MIALTAWSDSFYIGLVILGRIIGISIIYQKTFYDRFCELYEKCINVYYNDPSGMVVSSSNPASQNRVIEYH